MASPPRIVRFGQFEVDLDSNELRRRGVRLKLQEQPQNLLKVLLENPGALVTRDDLRNRLWTPDTYVEFDHSLNTAMMRLRAVLGDSSENPMYIETVPRKGYRFIAPVRVAADEDESSRQLVRLEVPVPDVTHLPESQGVRPTPLRASNTLSAHLPGRFMLRRTSSILAILGIVATVSLLFWKRSAYPASPPRTEFTSIAVLPMENLSGDPSQGYFADGMTDQLIASLARISSLRVVSRTTAMDYKGKHESLEKIARDLHVDAVMESTVLRSGDKIRITAELVQVSTDRHLWADTYESEMDDVITLQNRITAAIVSQIRIKLTPQDRESLATTKPTNPEAFEDYLKGRYYWNKRSEGDLGRAIRYFQSATEKDPNYALAFAGLADCYGILGAAIVGTVPTGEVAPKARLAAKRAIELDPMSAETQTALATVQFNDDWDWKAAESGFQRAIQLNPSYATAHQRYSLYLMAVGRTQNSLYEMNRARSLDPLSTSMNFSLGWRLYMARHYDEAITQLLNTVEMDSAYPLTHIVLAQCYEQKGRYTDAITELRKASALEPDSAPILGALGHVYAVSGKRGEALRLLGVLRSQSVRRYVSPFYFALIYAGLNDRAQALASLNASFEDRTNYMVFLNEAPQFDNLRNEPKFQSLRSQMGL